MEIERRSKWSWCKFVIDLLIVLVNWKPVWIYVNEIWNMSSNEKGNCSLIRM